MTLEIVFMMDMNIDMNIVWHSDVIHAIISIF